MRGRGWVGAWTLGLAVAALPAAAGTARAQGAPQGGQSAPQGGQSAPRGGQAALLGADASQQADEHFKRGKELYKAGKLREAHEAYRSAWGLKQTFDIAANLANTEVQLGMKRDAAEHLAFCIRNFPATGVKAQLDRVKVQFEDVRKQVGALVVSASVEGAEIVVDGQPVGRAPLGREVFVEPGAHTVEARLAGYEPARAEAQVAAGGSQEVALAPVKVKAAAVSGNGSGSGSGNGSGNGSGSGSGEDGAGPRTAVLIAGGAAAGAALVAGVIFTVVANGKADDAEEQRAALVKMGGPASCASATAACDDLRSAKDGKDTFSNAALWSFVGAGALGAATGIYAVVTSQRTDTASVKAMPVVMAGGGGIVLRGAW